jgi:hypothetical protein
LKTFRPHHEVVSKTVVTKWAEGLPKLLRIFEAGPFDDVCDWVQFKGSCVTPESECLKGDGSAARKTVQDSGRTVGVGVGEEFAERVDSCRIIRRLEFRSLFDELEHVISAVIVPWVRQERS